MRRALTKIAPLAAAVAVQLPAQQVQFTPYAVRPAASFVPVQGPVRGGFAVDDFDRDGRPDILVCETTSGRVHLGTGVRLPLPTTLSSQRPRCCDLDGDGDADVVLCASGQPLKVLRNDGNAFVDVPLPAPVAVAVVAGAALGDVDGDGDVDIVVSCSGQQLLLLRNDGAMQFSALATLFPLQSLPLPQIPALVDFDGDGDLDVLVSILPTGSRLWQNIGGSFVDASSRLPPLRSGARELCAADFDGDAQTDVAMLVNGALDVLWGTGTGFSLQQVALPATGAATLEVTDFDGDGDPDLIGGLSVLQLLQNLGGRQFAQNPIVNQTVSAFGVGDVDGDGRQDILFATFATTAAPDLVRFWRAGVGELQDAAFALGARWPAAFVRKSTPFAGDVDGDGRTDLLIPSQSGLIVDHARGDGCFSVTISAVPAASASPELPHLADLDLDGDPDLVLGEATALRAYRNDGSGGFTRVLDLPTPAQGIDDTRLGDVDGDGDLDLVRITSTNVLLVRNLGACTFASPQVVVSGSVGSTLVAVDLLDVDGDGDLDLVCNFPRAGGGHMILVNNGSGVFAPSAFAVDLGPLAISLAHFDMDGDGDQDLLVGSDSTTPLLLLRNNGSGVFTNVSATHLPQSSFHLASTVLCADFDADGDVDVFALTALTAQSGSGRFLTNDGTGHFTDRSVSRVGPFTITGAFWTLVAADIDDDGDLDILMGAPVNSFSDPQKALTNNLRQLRTATPARIGDVAEFAISNGPGFGPSGAAVLAVSFARASAPLLLPGVIGRLQLEPASTQIAAVVTVSSIGDSSVFVPVPASQTLIGLEGWLQAAIVPTTGVPALTNALYEIVLR